jgi:hypothetical protein
VRAQPVARPPASPSSNRRPIERQPPELIPPSTDANTTRVALDAPPVVPASTAPELPVSRVSGVFATSAPNALAANGAGDSASITPWRAAADGGFVLGRESRDAAVSTAGYFTQLGKRIANSF